VGDESLRDQAGRYVMGLPPAGGPESTGLGTSIEKDYPVERRRSTHLAGLRDVQLERSFGWTEFEVL